MIEQWTRLAAVGCLAISVGCRVDWQVIPETRGRVTRDGTPLPNVVIVVSDLNEREVPEDGCPAPVSTAITDSVGKFSLSEARRQTYWIPLPGDPSNHWRLCVLQDDTLLKSWDGRTGVYERDELELFCDIAADEVCNRVWPKDMARIEELVGHLEAHDAIRKIQTWLATPDERSFDTRDRSTWPPLFSELQQLDSDLFLYFTDDGATRLWFKFDDPIYVDIYRPGRRPTRTPMYRYDAYEYHAPLGDDTYIQMEFR